ncbi:MAG: amidohydrolase family protein [Kiritimatiellaeota bacterium]|nr:amidohydrolase family protein [Kiritimatiellota bacterium]
MFIDIHVHFRKTPGFSRRGEPSYATPEQLIARYDKLDIEKGVALPGVNPECAYVPQSNEEVLQVAQATGRFIPFCNIDPRALSNSREAPLGDILKYYRDQGCKGIGEVCANLHFLDPLVQNLFKGAREAGLPLTFHIAPEIGNNYGLFDQPGLAQLEESLQRFPELIFFGHSQAFWAEISVLKSPFDRWGYPDYPIKAEGRIPQLLRKYPNLYGDLSAGSGCNALKRDPEYAARFLEEFQDRLLFGTDICAPSTATPLVDFLLQMRTERKISEIVFQKIARQNAIKVLGLS